MLLITGVQYLNRISILLPYGYEDTCVNQFSVSKMFLRSVGRILTGLPDSCREKGAAAVLAKYLASPSFSEPGAVLLKAINTLLKRQIISLA